MATPDDGKSQRRRRRRYVNEVNEEVTDDGYAVDI